MNKLRKGQGEISLSFLFLLWRYKMTRNKSSYDYEKANKFWEVCDKENPTEEECIEAVKYSPFILGRLDPKYQTEKICIAAVKACGYVIKYVVHQTPDIQYWAVWECHNALQFIKAEDQTFYICFNSILYHPSSLQYVIDQTPDLCLFAINQYPEAIKHVHIPYTFEMIWTAFKKKPSTIKYVFKRLKEKKQNKSSKENAKDSSQGYRSNIQYIDESNFCSDSVEKNK